MSDSSWPGRGWSQRVWPDGGTAAATLARALSPRAVAAAEPFLAVAGVGAWIYDRGADQVWWSDETRRIHGVAGDFAPSLASAIAFYPDSDRPRLVAALEASLASGEAWDLEVPLDRADGVRLQVRVRGRADRQGGQLAMGTIEDVTARHRAAAQAAEDLARRRDTEILLRDVIAGIPTALSVYDAEERLILVNDMYRDILPGNRQFMTRGESLATIIANKVDADHYLPEIGRRDPPEARAAWVADYLRRHRSPGYRRIFHLAGDRWVQASTALSASGNIVSIRTDITPLMRAETELRRIAEVDGLTDLANRAVLRRRLSGAAPSDCGGLFVLLDVDFFKAVNDSLGHAAGDLLLRLIARRLQRSVRAGDTAARLAGDEFALILPGLCDEPAVAAFLSRLLARLRRPLRLGSTRYTPSLSVGATRFAGDATDDLFARADAALYEAKRQGRGRAVVFDARLAECVARRGRLADRLRLAVAAGEVAVALQPQQDLASGAVSGFEALARWQDGAEWVPPAEFIAIAEEIGLAQPLGTLIADRALAAFAAMLEAGLAPGRLAINVTTAQLLADDFLDTLKRLLDRHGVAPGQLEVEVTESVLLDRAIGRIGQVLAALRELGVRLAMDDFGTGYASLSHLTTFPVDCIKIDACFTRAIDQPGNRGLIARTIISLGRGLGLDVIAEGVETEAQRAFLTMNGCTAIQGWLVARPMLPDAAMDWLRGRHRRD